MEQTLRLHQHKPRTLIGRPDYLHTRTGGMIGRSRAAISSHLLASARSASVIAQRSNMVVTAP
jgi:hypothetical protein